MRIDKMKDFRLILSILMLLVPLFASAQEICTNLIDDDGDGLIDFLDPDCHCDPGISQNLIPNPGFENTTECCGEISAFSNCLEDWTLVGGTPDIFDLNCLTDAQIEFLEAGNNVNLTSSRIRCSVLGDLGEILGSCLLDPTIPNTSYEMTMDFGITPVTNVQEYGLLSVVGFYDCQELLDFDTNSDFCPNPINTEVLFTINVEEFADLNWHEISYIFSTNIAIEAIALSPSCDNGIPDGNVYFANYDNLSLVIQDGSWNYGDSIIVNGDPCESSFFLEVQEQDSLTYQWYYNGVPIVGETEYRLQLNGQSSFIDGLYQVSIQGSTSCNLVVDYLLEVPITYASDSFFICPGDSIFVGFKYWDEPGSYTIKYLDTFGPCQIQLEFFIEQNESYEFLTSEAICADESYDFQDQTYDETGIYTVPYMTQDGCDSNYILQLFVYADLNDSLTVTICEGNTYEFNGSTYDSDGTYTSYFTDVTGCQGSTTLFLTVASEIIGDTLNITIDEGAFYTFGGEDLTEEGIYTDTLVSAQGCDSIAILSLITEIPCSTYVPIVETDFGCELNSGFISVFLDTDQDVIYSIDGGATEQDNPFFENLEAGDYVIIVITEDCAINAGTFTLTAGPVLNGDLASASISLGDTITLSPSDLNFNVVSYFWEGNSSLSCDTCSFINVAPQETSTYSVLLTDENGCQITLNTTIFVEKEQHIYVPNIFSPNNDGVNDEFRIFSKPDDIRTVEKMAIYDRWGNELFRSEKFNISEDVSWDGKIRGQAVGTGVYTYMFLLSDGQALSGTVTIIR